MLNTNERIRRMVRRAMDKTGLTADGMAARLGMSGSGLRNFLNEKRGLSLDSADNILSRLGLEFGIRRKQDGRDG